AFPGTFAAYSTNQLDAIVDVVGFYSPNNPEQLRNLTFVDPVRVVDTRADAGGPIGYRSDGSAVRPAPLAADGATERFLLSGKTFGKVTFPTNMTGILVDVTVVQPYASGGYVTLFAGAAASPPHAS